MRGKNILTGTLAAVNLLIPTQCAAGDGVTVVNLHPLRQILPFVSTMFHSSDFWVLVSARFGQSESAASHLKAQILVHGGRPTQACFLAALPISC